jgi:hypothetical protein
MNSFRFITGSSLLALLFAFTLNASASQSSSAEAWLNNYYQNPAPERFESAVFELSRSGYFEKPGNVPLAIGFFASIFAEHPDRATEWMGVSRVLPVAHQRILASALWYSGHPRGAAHLRALAQSASPEIRRELQTLATKTPDLRGAGVQSVSSLNLQWGAFLASGEKTPVRNILAALGTNSDAQLSQNVRWSLAQNAVQHPLVLDICRDELNRQPNEIRETLRAVINDSEARRRPST